VRPDEPLIGEHQLINELIYLLKEELSRLDSGGDFNMPFLDAVIDFIRFYAHMCHHGKEFKLFQLLKEQKLSSELAETMKVLINDHKLFQDTLKGIIKNRDKLLKGNSKALLKIIDSLRKLNELYPKHIQTEEKFFFKQAVNYLTNEEQDNLIKDFNDFDMSLIHEKYKLLVNELKDS